MIEAYFPNLPKIELNRRGKPRAGWYAWGNEAHQKKRPSRDGQKREIAPEDLPSDTPQQQWGYSVGNMAGEAVSLPAFWDRTFGKGWQKFELSSDLVTLVQQAADTWAQIAEELTP